VKLNVVMIFAWKGMENASSEIVAYHGVTKMCS